MHSIRLLLLIMSLSSAVRAQGTLADYRRAAELRRKYESAAINVADDVKWLDATRFCYRRSVAGGHQFVVMDAVAKTKTPAFDHEKLAASLPIIPGEGTTANASDTTSSCTICSASSLRIGTRMRRSRH